MSTLQKASIIVLVILLVGAGLVFWKSKVGGHGDVDLTSMSAQEMQALVKDFNPMQLKALAESPEQKKQLVDNISQLLAIASQAKKEGITNEPHVKGELENMRITLLAMAYDKKINADKGPMPQFGFIGEDRVKEFWGESGEDGSPSSEANSNAAQADDANAAANANSAENAAANTNENAEAPKPAAAPKPKKDEGFLTSALDVVGLGWLVGNADARRHEAEFKIFLDNKLALLRERGQFKADQEPSEEEIKQAKDAFAKTRIYYEEAEDKLNSMGSMPEAERKEWEEFKESFELQAKLQEAQFLVQTYVQDKLSKKLQATDEEVQKYIADHPELTNTEEKKKKADEVLKKVQAGGDFAELAKEYSEDPGSKDNGGLYENIAKGQFAPEFEAAALALEPGQVAPNVVKTDFGYHIIKLEKKGEAKGSDGKAAETFSARHILISTLVKDPDNPTARDMPIDQFVKQKLEKEKQEKILEEIKKNNPVTIASDFKVPEPSAEELQKIQQQQQEQLKQMLEQQKGASEGEDKGPAEKE
jgi:foldase protein PrsA